MTESNEKSITLTRMIEAPADELFAAWTDPALLEQWQAETVEFDPFEGGTFRFESGDADDPDTVHVVTGTVLSFEENSRLVELWRYEENGDIQESTLIVSFRPVSDARTEITLIEESDAHEDPESRIFSIEAWNAALEELAELLE